MKAAAVVIALVLSSSASARELEPVSIGKGIFMLTDRNFTIFGSSDGIVAKLMTKANAYCQKSGGEDAELVDSDGSEAVPGTINNSGTLRRPAQGATGTIYFRCGSVAPPKTSVTRATLPDSYHERVESLRTKVMSGDIPTGKGIISTKVSSAFTPMSVSDVDMIEGRSTWWIDDNGTWFIHLQNVSDFDLEAFEFSVTFGSCSAPSSPVQSTVLQLQRPIHSGDQAVVNFSRPISTDNVESIMCGVVTSAWRSGGRS
jgi:hypothetical protein